MEKQMRKTDTEPEQIEAAMQRVARENRDQIFVQETLHALLASHTNMQTRLDFGDTRMDKLSVDLGVNTALTAGLATKIKENTDITASLVLRYETQEAGINELLAWSSSLKGAATSTKNGITWTARSLAWAGRHAGKLIVWLGGVAGALAMIKPEMPAWMTKWWPF